jgi:molybdopterin molybdotransferase
VPGNPFSSLVCFELFIRPALLHMQGAAVPARPVARLGSPVKRLSDRDHAMRCRLFPTADGMVLEPQRAQESHLIAHAAHADVIAFVDAGPGELEAGSLVEYVLL